MIKDNEDFKTKMKWLAINKACLEKTIKKSASNNIVAQLVLEKHSLIDKSLLSSIKETYNIVGYDYIFIWIDDFSSFTATLEEKKHSKN